MLYGFCPFEETTIAKLINLISLSQLQFPGDVFVSENLKVFLKRILTVKYKDRLSPG